MLKVNEYDRKGLFFAHAKQRGFTIETEDVTYAMHYFAKDANGLSCGQLIESFDPDVPVEGYLAHSPENWDQWCFGEQVQPS